MPSTKKFSELRDEARRDPERARRIEEAKLRALAELRQDDRAIFPRRRMPNSS
ncbi:hypothetical protein [Candidatus Poriferisodalis sp.]|uniref:hypothetical protein n=1 Tax=Candidatus Poriferisodalis sp. TaxID=3101277 RepID=UPI003B016D99